MRVRIQHIALLLITKCTSPVKQIARARYLPRVRSRLPGCNYAALLFDHRSSGNLSCRVLGINWPLLCKMWRPPLSQRWFPTTSAIPSLDVYLDTST